METSFDLTNERKIRVALRFATIDAISPWLLIIFYITGLDFVWLVNVNFLLYFIYLLLNITRSYPSVFLGYLFAFASIASALKLLLYVMASRDYELGHVFSYGFGLIMPLVALSFSSRIKYVSHKSANESFEKFAKTYLAIAAPGVVIYSILYFAGRIEYFGLGVNLHYVYPWFLTGKIMPVFAFLLLILISGKRSVLVNYLVQTLAYYLPYFRGRPIKNLAFVFAFFLSLFAIYTQTTLLDRFAWLFDGSFNLDDPYFLLVSGGGRFEELFGILDYFAIHSYDVVFGSPPGSFYIWSMDWSGYDATKNYSHITFFGYVFRYGAIFSVVLYLFFFKLIWRKLGDTDPSYLVVVGVVTSSFFGANLIIDPTSWLFVGFYLSRLRFGKQ